MARVLVVDDDPDFVEITRWILKARGHEVETATNGEMALRMMREAPPDLVILDVMMATILDGVYVVHAMREDADLLHIPVIMVSSIASSPDAAMFPTDEYLPVDMWITKPVQPDDLLGKVDRLIGHQAAT
jgi:CheY-like chemotaxis protein